MIEISKKSRDFLLLSDEVQQNPILKAKLEKFVGSYGYIQRFKDRNNLSKRKPTSYKW